MQSGRSVRASSMPARPLSVSISSAGRFCAANARRQASRSTASSSISRIRTGCSTRGSVGQLAHGPVGVDRADGFDELAVVHGLAHVTGDAQVEALDLVPLLF